MPQSVHLLPDYASAPNVGHKLNKVGITGHSVYRKDFNDNPVLTRQEAYVPLNGENGIHMSRLVAIMTRYEGSNIENDEAILSSIAHEHGLSESFWGCSWNSMYGYDDNQHLVIPCKLSGRLINNEPEWFVQIKLPYTSVCPCSAEMTRQEGGIPHMQRATADVTVQLSEVDSIDESLPFIISRTMKAVRLYPKPFMQRQDELAWCQLADEVNYFVEDAARRVASFIGTDFSDWAIVCTHEESIHQHNVVSVCNAGKLLK